MHEKDRYKWSILGLYDWDPTVLHYPNTQDEEPAGLDNTIQAGGEAIRFGRQKNGSHLDSNHCCLGNPEKEYQRTCSCPKIAEPSFLTAILVKSLNIILNRLQPQTKNIIVQEQAGFRAERSITEQIFNFRITCKKYLQHQHNLYHVFIDLKKAFYKVWHDVL